MILLRTMRVDPAIEALADQLAAASGEQVAMLIDERAGVVATDRLKVSITERACADLGLYTPADFGWRCGDYGFYLAAAQFPHESHFWMIEYDVRITGDAAQFFDTWRARPDVDLVAAHVAPTGGDWWWYANVRSSDAQGMRCFFPVVRLTARAVARLAEKRRDHSRRPLRRALWPNDESFAATAAVAAGLDVADINDAGQLFYDDATYSYTNILDGDAFVADDGAPRLHHPVLIGEDLARKRQRLKTDHGKPTPKTERAYRKIVAFVNAKTRW